MLITDVIYTGRDASHKRLFDLLREGKNLPFDIRGQIIYFDGPTPAKPGHVLGSAGPTTSYRMDAYSPTLIERGLKGMIGKGMRSDAVKEAMKKFKAIYFAATGGAGALLAKRVKKAEVIAYEVPNSPNEGAIWLKGHFSWRGVSVPVISFEKILGMVEGNITDQTRLIIFNSLSDNSVFPFVAMVAEKAAMESLACGLVTAITDLGALYETCAEFPVYVPYQNNRTLLATQFAAVIDQIPDMVNNLDESKMKFQQQYYRQFYHWNVIKTYWERFLNGI